MNLFQLHTDLLEIESRTDTLDGTLNVLEDAIRECKKAIKRAEASGPPECVDAVTDSECDMVEDLLGVAFVACQVGITRVVSRVIAIHHLADRAKISLTTTGRTRPDIIGFGGEPVGETQYTQVQIIDAFANYFRHRDEWQGSWEKLRSDRARTAKVITSTGAKQGCSGNLRSGADVLGNTAFDNLNVFSRIIGRWGDAVRGGYKRELMSRKLL